MNDNSLMEVDNNSVEDSFFTSDLYKNLPDSKKVELMEFYLKKRNDLSFEEKNLF